MLERLAEDETDTRSQSPWGEPVKTRPVRSETNPFADETTTRSGSAAALGGCPQETIAPPPPPLSQAADHQIGFGAFGMTSSIPGFRELMQSHENSRNSTPNMLLHGGLEPTSPTNTNPFQSPQGEKSDSAAAAAAAAAAVDDVDTDGSDVAHHPGISGLRDPAAGPFGSVRRVASSGIDVSSVDRSASSSVVGTRNFSGLGGVSGVGSSSSFGGLASLGGVGAWPSSAAIGTPTRERSAFASGFGVGVGDNIFGSMGGDHLQSPGLSTLGGGGGGGGGGLFGTGSMGRSSKLGSLFAASMQEQFQTEQGRPDLGGLFDDRQQGMFCVFGSPFGSFSPTNKCQTSSQITWLGKSL